MNRLLLGSFVSLLLLSGCGDEQKSTQVKVEPKQEVVESTNKNIETIKEKSVEILNSSKEIVNAVADESKKISEEVIEKAKVVSVEAAKEAKVITEAVAKDINKTLDSVIETKKENTVDVKTLYMKCAGCHGQNGEIHALGKSQIIKGWDESKIKDALLGYKAGTYGGNMKGVMKGQVMNLSDADIEALAEHISKF